MQTLAKHFAQLRAEADLSYSEVAAKCKTAKKTFSRHVVWKIENGRPVKADTLALVLRKGLGIPEDDEAYIEAMSLWSSEQVKIMTAPDVRRAILAMQSGRDRQFKAFFEEAMQLLASAPEADRPVILEALRHLPALKHWIASRK